MNFRVIREILKILTKSDVLMLQASDAKIQEGYFDYERWDVYQASLELIVLINIVVGQMPRGKAYLIDQLQRAGHFSITQYSGRCRRTFSK